jgi:hypothetical protein
MHEQAVFHGKRHRTDQDRQNEAEEDCNAPGLVPPESSEPAHLPTTP